MNWISVKGRMPEHGQLVLATFKDCGSRQHIIVGFHYEKFKEESSYHEDCYDELNEDDDTYYYREGWYEQQINWGEYTSIYVSEGEVTHWMPLPEPPEGDE